ncbi:proton-dependent oligopeptide transporter, POT family [Kytococcus aerolatus]|uniref:Proton-dependent oligopeptide transporter, POT family n=2 Tax=Kytococcus aerolatus TaxID=592308 RepID=A0A212U6H7_9MICO|nr:proton-dependent oligopeptide transporter, POT family [Kytococcus aerolatus]
MGQPGVLANLFNVELWERFSFYGMQVVLMLYLYFETSEGGLGLGEGTAAGIIGAYGASVYLFTIIGGLVADRLIGPERTLFFSAILIMCGHLALALLPGLLGVGIGLVLVAIGSGGLKANATTLVGELYSKEDDRRDAGFSIFYMGVNIGGLLGPLLTGWARQEWGFHLAFGLAAVGMLIGLLQYWRGRGRLPESVHHVPNPLPASQRGRWVLAALAALALIAALIGFRVVTLENVDTTLTVFVVIASVVYFAVMITSKQVTEVERSRVWAFVPLFLASAAFWSLFQQQFTVLAVYSDKRLNRDLFGWEVPIEWVNSINPVFIILFAPLFAALWTKLARRQPPTPVKFALGVILCGIAFLLFIPLAGSGANSVPVVAIVGILFVMTMGELMLSPVGSSVTTKLAPEAFQTQMVALYFLSVALGTAMSGLLAQFYSAEGERMYFGVLGAVALGIGALLLLVAKPVLSLMRGVR